MIKCIIHSTCTWASIKWTVSVRSKQSLALVQTSAKTKQGKGSFPLPLTPCNLSLRPKQLHMLEVLRKETLGTWTKAFGGVRMKADRRQTVDTKHKQHRGGNKSIKQGLDRAWPSHWEVTKERERKRQNAEKGGPGQKNWQRQGVKTMPVFPNNAFCSASSPPNESKCESTCT